MEESEGLEELIYLERSADLDKVQHPNQDYLSAPIWRPQPGLLAEQPDRLVALVPNVYSVSKLVFNYEFIAIICHYWHNIVMEFSRLLEIVKNEPVFETGLLLAGPVASADVRRQLSRWVSAGRLWQLRRGLYTLAPPYQKSIPHPFVVANAMGRGSYVSLQAALAYYGHIPEYTPVVTSVTTGRPGNWQTPLGNYQFHHVKPDWFHGYQCLALQDKQQAFIALPEKALLDLVALHPGGDDPVYLAELRLQALERLDLEQLTRLAEASGRPKLRRAAAVVVKLARAEAEEYQTL